MLRCLLSGQLMLQLHCYSYITIPYHTIGIFFFLSHWKKWPFRKALVLSNKLIMRFQENVRRIILWILLWTETYWTYFWMPLCASLNWKYFLTVILFAFPFCKTVITLWSFPLNVKYFPFLSVSWSKANTNQYLPHCGSHRSASHRPDVRCVVNSASFITEQ